MILIALLLVGLYFSGRLDHLLYNVGLNYHQCARNGFGAVFCGQELTDYQNRVQSVQQQSRQAAQQATQQLHASECQADPQLAGCP